MKHLTTKQMGKNLQTMSTHEIDAIWELAWKAAEEEGADPTEEFHKLADQYIKGELKLDN